MHFRWMLWGARARMVSLSFPKSWGRRRGVTEEWGPEPTSSRSRLTWPPSSVASGCWWLSHWSTCGVAKSCAKLLTHAHFCAQGDYFKENWVTHVRWEHECVWPLAHGARIQFCRGSLFSGLVSASLRMSLLPTAQQLPIMCFTGYKIYRKNKW